MPFDIGIFANLKSIVPSTYTDGEQQPRQRRLMAVTPTILSHHLRQAQAPVLS